MKVKEIEQYTTAVVKQEDARFQKQDDAYRNERLRCTLAVHPGIYFTT